MESDSPTEAILRLAKEKSADHIVMGSRGRDPISRSLSGSVSYFCTHHSDVPVSVVPPVSPDIDDSCEPLNHQLTILRSFTKITWATYDATKMQPRPRGLLCRQRDALLLEGSLKTRTRLSVVVRMISSSTPTNLVFIFFKRVDTLT